MSTRVLCLALALAACGPRDLVLVDLPPAPDGGRPDVGPPCADDTDCVLPMSFCDKPGCGSTLGNCAHKPMACGTTLEPVCGCNGVNYWNDCYRKERGITSAVAGECAAPITCSAAAGCSAFAASCALLLASTSSCSAIPSGVCWVLPSTCPAGDTSWESCSGPAVCEGFCSAIRSEAMRRQVDSCP